MDRKSFIKGSVLTSGSILLAGATGVYAQHITDNGIDKLTDANGNYIHQPLPYSELFLEPYMDAETMHLHYTFHHGSAVKAANKDMQMIKKAMDDNNLETVDHWTKKLSYHFS